MKPFYTLLASFAMSLLTYQLAAQQPIKVAIFAPVYIDSVFNDDDYRLGNKNLPKYILPGLDFYNGVMMAVDSLKTAGKDVEVLFYDSKGNESMYTIVSKPEFENIAMIIACFNNRNDVKPLADIALQRNIPLISATFPNDGGVTENPFFVLLNTSLNTHIQEIYKYIQRNHTTKNIVYVKRIGALEDMLFSIFTNANKTTRGISLNFKTIDLYDEFSAKDLTAQLDSTKQNLVICGSLNEAFGINVVKALSANNKIYTTTAVGMPTWDGLKELDRSDCSGINLMYSTSYNFPRNLPIIKNISYAYSNKLNARPSDMFFKGYESMYHFTSLLIAHPADVVNYLSNKAFKFSNDFVIEPLKNKSDTTKVDYLENKKIYFIKKLDGIYK